MSVRLIVAIVVAAGACLAGSELDRFAWLEGTWERKGSRGTIVESWQRVGDGTYEGTSTFVAPDGRSVEVEWLRLLEMGGEVFYLPRPRENPLPVAFKMESFDGTTAVFVNEEHDFPTRIVYVRGEGGKLDVRISGPDGEGGSRSIDFPFQRSVE